MRKQALRKLKYEVWIQSFFLNPVLKEYSCMKSTSIKAPAPNMQVKDILNQNMSE